MDNSNAKILIVEDDKGLRLSTQKLLVRKGYDVNVVENGSDGIDLADKNDYDILLIDLRLPDISGLEVLEKIKTAKPTTVCFIYTAYPTIESAIEATRLGAYNYLTKPFTPEEMLNQIVKGMRQRKILLESEALKIEREKNLLAIAHEKSRLNTIIEAISSGVLLFNTQRKVVYYNRACFQKLNLESISIEEKILDKIPHQISSLVNKIFTSADIHKSYTTEVEILPESKLIVEATCSPVPHPDGTIAGVVIVLKNITGLKKIENLKSQFVSMVAHELKSPLVAVLGYLDILTNQNLTIPTEKRIEYLNRSSLRIKSSMDLVNDLLDISRIELQTKHREIEKLNVAEVIKRSIEDQELVIKEKNLIVVIEGNEKEEILLKFDKNEFSKIINNVLSNAVKYNKQNGSIFIRTKIINNKFTLEIEDTGIGLKEEDRKKIFMQFFRAKNKFTRNINGTGLGLSIVKTLVEANHGKIDVESVADKGTKFIIHFPFK